MLFVDCSLRVIPCSLVVMFQCLDKRKEKTCEALMSATILLINHMTAFGFC